MVAPIHKQSPLFLGNRRHSPLDRPNGLVPPVQEKIALQKHRSVQDTTDVFYAGW